MPQLKPETWIGYMTNAWWSIATATLKITNIPPPPQMPPLPTTKTTKPTPTWNWPWQ